MSALEIADSIPLRIESHILINTTCFFFLGQQLDPRVIVVFFFFFLSLESRDKKSRNHPSGREPEIDCVDSGPDFSGAALSAFLQIYPRNW